MTIVFASLIPNPSLDIERREQPTGILAVQKLPESPLYLCIQETLSRIRERVREARVRVYRIRLFLLSFTENLVILEFTTSPKAGF